MNTIVRNETKVVSVEPVSVSTRRSAGSTRQK